jgi:hypothetical protein
MIGSSVLPAMTLKIRSIAWQEKTTEKGPWKRHGKIIKW